MADDDKLVVLEKIPADYDELPQEEEGQLEVGQWYWVTDGNRHDRGDEPEKWLGCLTHLGSNYAEITSAGEKYNSSFRAHLDKFDELCVRELNPDEYLDGRIKHYSDRTNMLMGKVKAVTARLGVARSPELHAAASTETRALTVVNSNEQIDTYKADLIKAKDDTLPELFKQIKESNEAMACWMKAKLIPLEAEAGTLTGVLKKVNNRIHSVELYAGLTEDVIQFADGEPAPMGTKIHLLQRRHYMDEECLAQYKAGGMDFKDMAAFEAWLAEPENRDRLLPFPRCVVAFRVRRHNKDREMVNITDYFCIVAERAADMATFLYIRNGERLYCLQTDKEFDEKLFPDLGRSQLNGKLWANTRYNACGKGKDGIITDDQYQGMIEDDARELAEWEATDKAYEKEWKARKKEAKAKGEDPKKVHKQWAGGRPEQKHKNYSVYSPDSVFYDDITEVIQDSIQKHNRLVLILQGLLDRSLIFHPHPPWSLWSNEGFAAALELVYDSDRALAPAELPDFEAYRQRLNKTLKAGDVVVGQEEAWLLHEGKKESRRLDNDWRDRGHHRPERFRPYGNPGPGMLAKAVKVTRTGKVTFAWMRERLNDRWGEKSPEIRTTLVVPKKELLNVSAYKPGDFKQFFNDPRTRVEYLKWAPLLLEAEEYHAGNREVLEPPEPEGKRGGSLDGKRRYQQRRRQKQLMGKQVKLLVELKTKGGDVYEKGSLWTVTNFRGDEFDLQAVDQNGFIRCVPYWDFELSSVE